MAKTTHHHLKRPRHVFLNLRHKHSCSELKGHSWLCAAYMNIRYRFFRGFFFSFLPSFFSHVMVIYTVKITMTSPLFQWHVKPRWPQSSHDLLHNIPLIIIIRWYMLWQTSPCPHFHYYCLPSITNHLENKIHTKLISWVHRIKCIDIGPNILHHQWPPYPKDKLYGPPC